MKYSKDTLVNMLVLTLLDNKFILKILNSTPFRPKIHNIFGQKPIKVNFSPNQVVLGLYCNYMCKIKKYETLYSYNKALKPLT